MVVKTGYCWFGDYYSCLWSSREGRGAMFWRMSGIAVMVVNIRYPVIILFVIIGRCGGSDVVVHRELAALRK